MAKNVLYGLKSLRQTQKLILDFKLTAKKQHEKTIWESEY